MQRTRLKSLRISGYRSIRDEIYIGFPEGKPLVLIGENNAGKSNIISALDIILGETWPGSREPEDHDFWNRDVQNGKINIEVEVEGVKDIDRRYGQTIPILSLSWMYNPQGIDEKCRYRARTGSTERYCSNEIRDQLMAVVIGADRRLSYQLSYASKYTFLSKLMHRFHRALISDTSRVQRLKEEFEKVKRIFQEVGEFVEFEQALAHQFDEMFTGMSYRLQIDFSAYDPSRFFHSLRVMPKENTEIRTFDELGTGQEQILALAFAYAYAKAFYGGIVLVIEEPEAHLHPLAQYWLSRRIRQMCRDGLQIVITTHSPAFVDILDLESTVLVRKNAEGATQVLQLTCEELANYCKGHNAHAKKTTPQSILPYYAAHATQEILGGFFAKKVVLVEGQTESLSLPIYLERVGLDANKEGIAIIPVMGKGNLAKWWRLFTAYGIPVYIVFDNDAHEDQDAKLRTDALITIGIQDDEEIREAISTDDWLVRPTYAVFGKNFESCMKRYFPGYEQLEREVREIFGDSKPIVARCVAQKLCIDEAMGNNKLQALAQQIKNL